MVKHGKTPGTIKLLHRGINQKWNGELEIKCEPRMGHIGLHKPHEMNKWWIHIRPTIICAFGNPLYDLQTKAANCTCLVKAVSLRNTSANRVPPKIRPTYFEDIQYSLENGPICRIYRWYTYIYVYIYIPTMVIFHGKVLNYVKLPFGTATRRIKKIVHRLIICIIFESPMYLLPHPIKRSDQA